MFKFGSDANRLEQISLSPTNFVLGISYNYHDAGAVLLKDGEILGAVEEERFTRIKGDKSFPINSIDYLLCDSGINIRDISMIVYYESPYLKFNRLISTLMLGRLTTLPLFIKAINTWLDSKLWVEKDIKKYLGKNLPTRMLHHHLSHGASAFFPSPFEDAVVLTIDGVGEWSTTTLGYGENSSYHIDQEITFPNSLGLLYSAFTHFTGFKINSGEYKMMGLAPFGKPKYVDLIKRELINLHEDGSYTLNPKYFSFDKEERTYNYEFVKLIGSLPRNPKDKIREIDQDLAASIQIVLNEAVLNLCRVAKAKYSSVNLVLAGGVALNVVTIGEIERSGIFNHIWVQPCSGDGGGALGAALYHYYESKGSRIVNPLDSMKGSFLGPNEGNREEIIDVINEKKLNFRELNSSELPLIISSMLAEGKIVGICRGRMEYGPRALGNRSILADARALDMQERLNLKTKFREGFRPFAPMILEEEGDKILDNFKTSPYMLKTYYLKEKHRLSGSESKDIMVRVKEARSPWPAITHIDYSCRVQSIDGVRNPFIYNVLTNFHKLTGSPIIVNTSFNVRGEPIVLRAREAIEGFLNMDIDSLLVGDFLIEKKDNLDKINITKRKFMED